jgi:hypothetical protein
MSLASFVPQRTVGPHPGFVQDVLHCSVLPSQALGGSLW